MSKESSLLSDLGTFYESIPFEYLLVGHCLLVASWFPKLKDRYLLSYWVSGCPSLKGSTRHEDNWPPNPTARESGMPDPLPMTE